MTFCSSSAILVSNMATSSRSWAGVNSSRSGGGITHSLNRKLRSLRIQKIRPALDRRGGVTFPTHLGEPPSATPFSHGDRHGQLSADRPCPRFCGYYVARKLLGAVDWCVGSVSGCNVPLAE